MIRNLLLLTFLVSTQAVFAQSRQSLRDAIKSWGTCKSVAITTQNGNVAIYGTNGYHTSSSTPVAMTNRLRELNNAKNTISDVIITENGRWIIIYDEGVSWSNDIPYALAQKIREFNQREAIWSVALNDNNEWVIVGKEHYSASSQSITDYLNQGHAKYGKLWTVHMTNSSMVAVYEDGYRFLGEVPTRLKEALSKTSMDVLRLKYLPDGSYFISDGKAYDYWM